MAGWVTLSLCPFLETFWTNPQFRLTLLEPDEEDEEEDGSLGCWGAAGARGPARGARTPKCTVLLSLIQRNQRRLRAQGLRYLTVGFHVFQVGPRAEQRQWGARGRHRGMEVQEAKAGSEGVERGWRGRRGSGWGPRVRVRRQLRTSEIQGEAEGLGSAQRETEGQRAEGKESEKGLEKRLRIWEWTQEQRRHLRAQTGGDGQEGQGQELRGRAFRRGGVGRKEAGMWRQEEGLRRPLAASWGPDSPGSSFLQIPEEVGIRKDPRFHPSLNQPQRLLQPGGLRRAWGDR